MESNNCRRGQYAKFTSIANNAKLTIFCMNSLIANMHRMLIEAIGCVTGVIEVLC